MNEVDRNFMEVFGETLREWLFSFLRSRPWYDACVKSLKNQSDSSKFNTHCWRSHTCGELSKDHVGRSVTLTGWVEFVRQDKFIILRDWNGSVQLLLQDLKVSTISLESVVKVTGTIQQRPAKDVNEKMKTGNVEVKVEDLEVLNPCTHLPIPIHDFLHKHEDTRMQYRYLDIRTKQMQDNLRLRSKVISRMREFLTNDHEFVEVETPTLFRPTPGGATEFIVPSSTYPGLFFSLPQSPQQFKQLLMVGGIDRYFQVARCYRDESTRPDRQPEFTQLDLEMSFVSAADVMQLTENLIKYCWPEPINDEKFPRMSFEDVMECYGTDKPDTRYEMMLKDVTEYFKCTGLANDGNTVNAFVVPQSEAVLFSKNLVKKLRKNYHKEMKSLLRQDLVLQLDNGSLRTLDGLNVVNTISQDFANALRLKEGDLVWVGWGKRTELKKRLGKIRTFVADALEKEGSDIKSSKGYRFLWIYDFPLFERKEDGELYCVHHPFTAPHPDDIHLLDSDPTRIRSLAYDLVLNGEEVAGGSIRIHDPVLQRKMLEQYLNFDSSQLEHMLTALGAGAPPHGGIAIGLDRLLAVLCGAKSIRDVIAFPKTATSRDLMCNAPCKVDREILEHYHLKNLETHS